jgi:ATP-dependent Lhr-like helicase
MLVFTNTRRLSERLAHDLGERMGHEHRARAPRLHVAGAAALGRRAAQGGPLKVMVATASLELGIDVGSIDLVVQLGSPRNIAVMLQRLGRSGHHKSAISKGVLYAMTRDELVECAALLRAIHEGQLDAVRLPEASRSTCSRSRWSPRSPREEWDERRAVRRLASRDAVRGLTWQEFEKVLHLVSGGRLDEPRPLAGARAPRPRERKAASRRKGARLMALQNGGAIPDLFTYPAIAEPDEKQVGTLDEDFAVDSMAGDVFVLGSTSWRIRRIFDGQGARRERPRPGAERCPSGEARRRAAPTSSRSRSGGCAKTCSSGTMRSSVAQETLRVPAGRRVAGALPARREGGARRDSVDEDPAWSPSASSTRPAACSSSCTRRSEPASIARGAWRLRKSFCRAFDFELQAAATDDGDSACRSGEQHSFPLMDIFDFVSPGSAERVLTQAVLQAPVFGTRFRWVAGRALALSRLQQWKAGASADSARARGRPHRGGVPRAGRLSGQPRREGDRPARPSPRQPRR